MPWDDNDDHSGWSIGKMFGSIDYSKLRKAGVSDPLRGPRNEPDDKKVSAKIKELVAEMIRAAPSLHPQTAARWLLHSEQGQNLLAQHKGQTMTQVDILKVIAVTEDALMAQAKLQKRAGESDAKAFARLYEDDIEYRKQWRDLNDAKQLQGYLKSLASLKPTSTEAGSTLVSDDSAEAIRQLNEMATKQGRTFEQVFADPANKALAGKTYTGAHLPTASSPVFRPGQ
jgi:peptidyl-tRNA hydrolase